MIRNKKLKLKSKDWSIEIHNCIHHRQKYRYFHFDLSHFLIATEDQSKSEIFG